MFQSKVTEQNWKELVSSKLNFSSPVTRTVFKPVFFQHCVNEKRAEMGAEPYSARFVTPKNELKMG